MIVSGIPFVQGRNAYTDTDGRKYGIAIHDTSNTATAEGEADYATRRTDGISAHFYVDADSVVQSIDTRDRCGHAGSSIGNENSVAVEITGMDFHDRAWWLANVAWDLFGRVLAQVIRAHWPDGSFQVRRASVAEMKANPKVKAFYAHDDMRQAWGHTDHTDPGPGFPWDRLFGAVNAALGTEHQEEDMIRVASGKASDEGAIYLVSGVLGAGGKYFAAHITSDPVNKAHEAAGVKLVQLPKDVGLEESGLYTTTPATAGGDVAGAYKLALDGAVTLTAAD